MSDNDSLKTPGEMRHANEYYQEKTRRAARKTRVNVLLTNARLMVLLVTTLLVVSLVLMGAPGVSVAQTVVVTVPVGTNPWAVGVNPTTNKIYVANQGSNTVSVINGADNSVVATVPVGRYPYAVGANPETDKVYVANICSNTVSVINGADNSVATVPVGVCPIAVGVNPTTNKVYVANMSSSNVSVIDGASDRLSRPLERQLGMEQLQRGNGLVGISLLFYQPLGLLLQLASSQ